MLLREGSEGPEEEEEEERGRGLKRKEGSKEGLAGGEFTEVREVDNSVEL